MRKLTCYAWGKPGDWEALCVDLDIATQGESLAYVREDLQLAVEDFLDYAAELPEANRKFLLSHRVPLGARMHLLLRHRWITFLKSSQRLLGLSNLRSDSALASVIFTIDTENPAFVTSQA